MGRDSHRHRRVAAEEDPSDPGRSRAGRGLRSPAARRAAALLLGVVALAALPAPTEAQGPEIWSATLTVSRTSFASIGCDECNATHLSDLTFVFGGRTYTVQTLTLHNGSLVFSVGRRLSGSAERLALQIGDFSRRFRDRNNFYAGPDNYQFTGTGLSWSLGDTVAVRIIDPTRITDVQVMSTPRAATDIYGAGETIEIWVTFSDAVNATENTDLVLSVSGGKRAALLRGSGTKTLVFGYTVQAGDEDTDGIFVGDADDTLVGDRDGNPQSGTITLVPTGEEVDLTHDEVGSLSGHKVDGSLTPSANDAPVITTTSPVAVAENGTAVATLAATDADDDPITWSKTGGADAGRFALTDAGVLTFEAPPDYESPADVASTDPANDASNNEYVVFVTARDGADFTELELVVQVTNANEATGTEIADADGVEDGHQVALAVGQNVIKVRVTSQDGSMTRTYTVTVTRAGLPELSVANAAAAEGDDVTFTVTLSPAATEDVTATWTASIGSGDTAVAADLGSTTTGTLTFTAGDTEERFTVATAEDELDEENETFTVTLSSPSSNAMLATDPTATGTITAADALPNSAPVITTTSPVAVAENGTSVATLAATDADRDPIAWSKTGGADADRFALSAQGVLTFKAEPDYESPADVASADPANDAENNEYVVFVTASDGTDAAELQLVVRVTNANDAPTGTVTIDDTSPMIGDVLTASAAAVADPDGLPDPFAPAWQWYRTPTDGSETEIDRATAATYTVVRADYDATLTAKATWTDNGGFTNTLASAATDETPRPSCTQNPGDVWCGVVTVEWYEPLSGDGYAPAFDSDPQVGDLSNKNFAFRGMPYTIDLILVERKTGDSFFEGVYFSLDRALPSNARDALVLYIGPTSRPPSTPSGDTSLSFQPFSRVDYASNTYTYRWLGDKRSEGGGPGDPGFVEHGPGVDWSNQTTVTVRLRENAPPVFMSAGPFTVDENETTVGTVTATDADPGDTYLRYAITGGADRYESDGTTERFEIDDTSGELSFKSAPNYEDPQDDGADNVYEVEVEARSGMDTKATAERGITNRTTQPIMVTVADVPEQPAKPAKPTLAAVADSTTSLRVSWTKPDLNGGPEITGYNVEYATGTDGEWTALEDTALEDSVTAVTAIITGLSADTEYEARVQAENGERPSDWSEPSDPFSPKSCALNPGDLWCGVVTVAEAIAAGGTTTHGFLELLGAGDLDGNPEDKMFRGYTIGGATVTVGGALGVVLDRDLSDADWATLALHVDDHSEPFAFSTASTEAGVGTYTWDGAGLDWSSESTVTLRLRETDPPMLSVAPASATEGEAVAFTVTLSPATGRQVTVDWERSIGSGDTAETEDFADLSAATGTLTFAAKVTGQTMTVATAQDTDEDDETFTVTLSNQSPSVVQLANATATGRIDDDDGLPKVTIMAAEDTVTEGTDAVFTLSRTGSTAAALPVSVAVTQQADRDLLPDGAAAARMVTFAADAATAALTVELEDDTLRELAGDLTVEVQAGTGYTVGNPSRAVVDVRDGDQGAPLTPQGLTAAPGAAAGEVVLTWTAPAPHLAYDLHQYRYKTDGADGSWTDIPDSGRDDAREGANLARYTVTGLAGGQEHTFQVRARISYDTPSVNVFSAASNEAKATPPVPAVTLHLTDSSANAVGNGTVLENRGTITVTATVAPASATPFTVTVTASPVAPATDADFTLSADPVLSFAAGATASTGTVTIGVVDDDVPEPSDVVTVSGAVSDPAVTAPEDVTLTIANDDVDVPFDITVAAPAAVAEDAGTASVTVTLTTQENVAPTIGTAVFFSRGGTAEDGDDYTSPVTVPPTLVTTLAVSAFSQNADGTAWVAQTMFTIGIVDDGLDEADETIVFRIATQNDAAPDQTITITDDDAPPSVSFGAASYAVDEGGSVEVAVVLSARSGRERVEVPLAHEGEGGAALPDDYSGVPAEVTFAAGETERKFTIEAPADAYAETGEGVALSFGTLPDGATAGSVAEATVSLNDVAVTVSFEQAAYTAAEGGSNVAVALTLTPALSHVLRVTMVAQHGAGATAADYRGIEDGRDALFTAGQTHSRFDVTATDDALDEADETVTLGFTFATSDTGLTKGSVAEATLTLTDDDDPPGVEDVMAASAVEGEPVQFAVTLTEASGRTVNLGWEVRVDGVSAAAADFDPFPQDGVLTFAPGDTTRTITVATAQDTVDEEDETFEVRITPDGNVDLAGSLTVTGTIEDDDREPGLSVEDASATEGGAVEFTVRLAPASGKRVTVDWRASAEPGDTAGAGDFTAANGTLTFTAGQRSKTVGVATARDGIEEEDESFTLTLSNPTNATLSTDRTATGTIDGDPLVLSVASGSAVEGNEVRFTATLSVASTQDVTVDWEVWLDDRSDTAEPEDFADLTAEHGTLTIDAGQTTGTVRVGTAADTLPFETSESFTLLLSNPVNATVADPTVRGTIVNRPPPAARTAFTALPRSNTEVVLAWEAATRESVVQAGVPSNTYVPLFIEMSLNAEMTRHEYRYKTVGGAYPATWTAIADSASGGANAYGYTVAGLSNETVYKFQLRTVGVGGNGRPVTSNAVTPTPGICDRTPQVRDAIVAEVPGVADCAHVKLAHLAAIRRLDDHGVGTIEKGIESLRVNDFAGLTNLDTLNLGVNELTELPTGVFAGLTNLVTLHLSDNRLTEVHAGEFAGLTKLTNFSVADNQLTEIPGDLFAGQPYLDSIRIRNNRLSTLPDGLFAGRASPGLLFVDGNTVDPLPLTVTLEPVGLDQVRAKVPAGAPFEMRLPVTVTDGALADGLTTLTVAAGSVESTPVTVYRTAGTGGAVTVDLGTPLPSPPELHWGYVLTPAASGLPVTVPAAQIAPAAPVEENTTAVRTLRASDAGGGTVTWSKTGGADAARFALTAAGVLTFVSAPDYEAPADVASADPRNDAANNEYVVFVTPSDGTELRLVVRVTNVNEAPTAGTVTIDDMTPAVGVTLTATVAGLVDPDGLPEPFTTLSWQWYRTPADGSETVIPGAIGATYTAAAADLGATLTAKATYTDGGGFDNTLASDSTAAVLPNTAPVITTTSPVAVAENGTAVATLAATDADRNPIAWSKTGGADADRFALSAQGVLTFKAEPDYESPADVASIDPSNDADNNEYVVFVTASDGTDDTELQLVVRVTNANDAPTGTVTIDDTSPTIGDVLTASAAAVADQDGLPDPFAPAWQWYRTPMGGSETEIDRATAATYTVVRADYGATLTAKATWTDNGGFTNTLASAATEATTRPFCTLNLNPGDVWCGVVTVEWYPPLSSYGYAPAFGSDPQVGDLSNKNFTYDGTRYTIDIIAVEPPVSTSYGGVYFSLDRALSRNGREALLLYIGPTSRTSSLLGVTSLSAMGTGADHDETTHTFYWRADGDTDVALDDLGPGVDWSNQTTVTVRLRQNAAPVFNTTAFAVDENETAVDTVTATDADPGDTYLRYAITGGADRYESDGTTERFEIDDTSGALSFKSAPNYEDPQDDGADNIYEVEVEARSGMDLKQNSERGITNRTRQTITVTVLNVPDQPAKPAKPTLAAVADSTTSLRVNWTKPDLNGGPEITGYNVAYREYATGTDGEWTALEDIGTAVTAIITGLNADTEYEARVQALNDKTPSAWSDPSDPFSPKSCALNPGDLWCGVVTVAEAIAAGGTTTHGFLELLGAGDLDGNPEDKMFRGYTIAGATVTVGGNAGGALGVVLDRDLSDADWATLALHVDGQPFAFSTASTQSGVGTYTWPDAGLDWSSASTVTLRLRRKAAPTLSIADARADEGGAVAFTVTLSEAVAGNVTVDWTASRETDDTAESDDFDDLSAATGTLTIDASETAATFTVATAQDADEDDETFTVTLSNPSPSGVQLANATATGMIRDDDGLPEVTITATPDTVTEGTDAVFTLSRTGSTAAALTVTVEVSQTEGVLADAESDWPSSVDFEAGSADATLTLATDDDDTDGADGTVTVTLVADTGYEVGTPPASATVTITDDDNAAPEITTTSPVETPENTTAAATLEATDAAADTIEWSKTGGADQGLFSIDSSSGELTFDAAPDYEDPTDTASADPANGAENNEYVVFVTASDGTDDTELQLVVRVTNANDAPTGTVTIDDTTPMIGDVLTASAAAVADQDGLPDPFAPAWQWYRTPTDGSETEIDRATAATYTVVAADYDATLTAKATWTDVGGFTNTLASAATDETPRPSCTQNPGDVWCGVVTVERIPLEILGNVSYGYVAAFPEIMIPQVGDLSNKNFTYDGTRYTIDIIAVEPPVSIVYGGVYFSLDRALSRDGREALLLYIGPTSRNSSPSGVTSLSSMGTGADHDETTHTFYWRADGDTDAALDDLGPGVDWSSQTTVTVRLRENAAPVFMSAGPFTVNENETTVGTVTATDADPGDTYLRYAITGGADRYESDGTTERFEIDDTSGALSFKSAPNYEDPQDDGADNVYEVEVEARSGMDLKQNSERGITNRTTQPIMVTVADVPEQPAKPAKPTLAAVADSTTSLRVNWTKPDLNGGPEITGYNVAYREYATGTDGEWTALEDIGTAVTAIITGLSADTEYEARVQAENGERPSDWSDPSDPFSPKSCALNPDDLWCGVVTVAEAIAAGGTTTHGFLELLGAGDLDGNPEDKMFRGYTIGGATVTVGGALGVVLDRDLSDADWATLALHVDDHSEPFAFSTASTEAGVGTYTWDGAGLDWSSESTVTLRLRETDPPMLSVAPASATEGEAVAFTVTLSPATGRQVTVDWERSIGSGDTAETEDFADLSAATGTLTFAAKVTGQTITVATAQDTDEDDETFTVTLSNQSPSVVQLANATAAGRIDDDDGLPDLGVAAAAAAEGDGVEFTVTLSATAAADVTATWTASLATDDTAETGDFTDLSAATGTLTFSASASQTTATVTVATEEDTTDEEDETFTVTLSSPSSNAELGASASAQGTIRDDDDPPAVSFGAASYAVDEGGSVEVAVVLSARSGRERVEVPLAHEGEGGAALPDDYSGVPAEVTFAAGETEKRFTIEAPADAYAETGEGVALSFGTLPDGAEAGSVREATVSLHDVAVTVSFEQAAYTAAEGGAAVTLTLTLDPPVSHVLRVMMVAQHGEGATAADYRGIEDGRDAIFTAGQTRSDFDVTAVDDALDEADETVTFGFTIATSYTGLTAGSVAEATLTLADDDDPPGVEDVMAASAVEGEPVQFAVTLTEASGRTVNLGWQVRVDGVSAAAADFDPFPQDGVLTFAPGDTTRTITVATAEDTADEEDETFKVRITPDGNVDLPGSLTVTGMIEDDDREPGLSVEDASATEGGAVAFTVRLAPASGKRVTVDWRASAEPGDTAGAGDFTAANGTLTFTAGQRSKTVGVATARDGIEEEDESFTLTLSTASNAALPDPPTARGTIEDETAPPPVAPEAEAVAGSYTSLEVRWGAPDTVGGLVLTGYELRYGEHPGGGWNDWPHAGIATEATITGLQVDTAYRVEVRAVYGELRSVWVRVPGSVRTAAPEAAVIRSMRAVTGPGSDGVWNAGERVEVEVRYSLPVVVERPAAPWHDGFGRPREPGPAVALLFNTGPRPGYGYGVSQTVARYAGGSETDTLAFGYTVTAADAGAGSVVVASSLLLRGAEIRTLEGGEAETYLGRRTVVVVPEVLLDDSGDDVWTAGETILVRFRFTGEVRVSTTGGTPTVGLRFGDAEGLGAAVHAARYTGGSGSDTLTFEYGVRAADGTVRVVGVVADSLALNGGTIRNPRGKDAYLDHLSTVWAAWRQVEVQWPEVGVSSGAAAREGGVLRFTVALRRASILPVRVECATRDGTATAGEDYLARHAVLLFEPGETEKTVAVAVLTDGRAEGEETVLLRLLKAKTTWPDGLAHIVEAEAQGTIVDVAGRGPGSRDAGGLTARFVGMPAEHDGESGIRFRVAFSEDIGISFRALREDAFTVSGGRVTGGRRVDGRRDLFEMTVRPESFGAVTITLPAGRECGVSGAICTKGEPRRTLTNTPSATVRGPAMLSVADARAREGEDETIDFAVTLDRAAAGPVTVAYATADRTARAGSDYTRTSGKLSFAAGETELTVRVPVLDDAHDEGEETLVLRLTQASGARIADGEAVGTIENADPLPAAWLARFGRTAGGHVLAAVGERLRGGGQPQATVAGRRLQGADAAAVAEAQAAYERAWARRLQEGRLQARPRAPALRDLVAGSSFSVAAAAEPAGRWTVWGRGAWSRFAGRADGGELKLDGDVVTATAGADYERGAVLAGLALAYSTGSGTYDHDSERSGTVASTLLSVHPYARVTLHERLAVWGLFGYGLVGHLTQDDAAADAVETGTGLLMGAFGVDGLLLAAAQSGGLELAARADGLLLRMSSAAAAGLAASEADLSRWRLLLEASYAGLPLFGGELRPALAVGGRYDAGAAETGAGLVLGGRLSYALPAWGLTLSAGGEGLLVHEEDGFREWGAGGSLRFDPGAPGRGLALKVAPSWGVAASGAGRLWALPDAASLAPAAVPPSPGARLAAELSYGLDAPGALTPYAGVALAADGARTWRVGTRLRLDSGLAVSLQGIRAEPVSAAPDHTLALTASRRW